MIIAVTTLYYCLTPCLDLDAISTETATALSRKLIKGGLIVEQSVVVVMEVNRDCLVITE